MPSGMIPVLCLALAVQGPRIEAARGRVVVLDAQDGAMRPSSEPFEASAAGVLELGASSSARVALPGRMSLQLEGPASLEWRDARQHLLRCSKARWDWRGGPGELHLARGLVLRGGPGAYELEEEASGWRLRALAGAALELHDGHGSRLLVPAGATGRWSSPRGTAVAPLAWTVHEWPWQAPRTTPAGEPRQWWPAAFACADARPATLHARALAPEAVATAPSVEVSHASPSPTPAPEAAEALPATMPATIPAASASAASTTGWPCWLRARTHDLFVALHERWRSVRSWVDRWRALHAFGVAFDPTAPFEVLVEEDRLELRLAPQAKRAERVRGTSVYLMQPGAAIVLARGGRLLSHAGDVDVRTRAY